MSGADIQAEIDAALGEVAQEVGTGTFTVTLVRSAIKDTPWDFDIPESSQTWTMNAMVDSWTDKELADEMVKASDIKVMIAGGTVQPQTGDKLQMNGEEYTVIPVQNAAFSGVALYHIIGARK